MRIRKILGVLSILAVFIFVLTGCSKYSFDVKGTYKTEAGSTMVIDDKEVKYYKADGTNMYAEDEKFYYERLGENIIRVYTQRADGSNKRVQFCYYVYEGGIIKIQDPFVYNWEYTKE